MINKYTSHLTPSFQPDGGLLFDKWPIFNTKESSTSVSLQVITNWDIFTLGRTRRRRMEILLFTYCSVSWSRTALSSEVLCRWAGRSRRSRTPWQCRALRLEVKFLLRNALTVLQSYLPGCKWNYERDHTELGLSHQTPDPSNMLHPEMHQFVVRLHIHHLHLKRQFWSLMFIEDQNVNITENANRAWTGTGQTLRSLSLNKQCRHIVILARESSLQSLFFNLLAYHHNIK